MSIIQSQIKKYPLLPFSQLVYDSTRWMPKVYMFGMTMRIPGGAESLNQWQNALVSAFSNHPVFSTYIDCQGRQYEKQQADILKGKYHQVIIRVDGKDLEIQGHISRILGDGVSMKILFEDICQAYNKESLQKDDYWEYLEYVEQQKLSQHYADSRDWLIREFADETIPVRPTIDRHLWTLCSPKAGLYKVDYTDLQALINQLTETEFLSMDGFFSLCTALAIAEYCGTDSAAITWAYEGRERLEEQRIFGSLHRDVPFKINIQNPISNFKSELIRQARNQIRSGIAHSDYPYTLTAPYNKRWNYAVNVLRVEDEYELLKLLPQPVELMSSPPQKYAYALLDVEIHESVERLEIVYRYSASHYKEESIKRFASLVRKYAEWLLEKE